MEIYRFIVLIIIILLLIQLMPLLSHPSEEIVYEVLVLLKVLLECGNKTVQAGLAGLISTKEHTLFPTLQRMLKQSAVAYRERYDILIYYLQHFLFTYRFLFL